MTPNVSATVRPPRGGQKTPSMLVTGQGNVPFTTFRGLCGQPMAVLTPALFCQERGRKARLMKRTKRLTKRERKSEDMSGGHDHQHIHCIVCGRHIDGHEFSASPA